MNTAPEPTEALATIGKLIDMLPVLTGIPYFGPPAEVVPGSFQLNTDTIGKGHFSIAYAYPSGYTPGRNVEVDFTAGDDQTRPIRVTRNWITITDDIVTVKTTQVDRSEVADEIAAALDWLCTA